MDSKRTTTTEFLEFVGKLLTWMDAAKQGKIQIIPKKFIEKALSNNIYHFGKPIPMRYRVSQGNQKKESATIDVDGEKKLWEEKSEDCPSLTVSWVPGGEKIVIEIEQLDDGKKVSNKGQDTWTITGDIITKSDYDLPKEQTLKTKDPDYEFSYTIRRIGFGPIPKLPVWAK